MTTTFANVDARFQPREPESPLTLLDLVLELCAAGARDDEVVFAVLDLVESGRVRLLGRVDDGPAAIH